MANMRGMDRGMDRDRGMMMDRGRGMDRSMDMGMGGNMNRGMDDMLPPLTAQERAMRSVFGIFFLTRFYFHFRKIAKFSKLLDLTFTCFFQILELLLNFIGYFNEELKLLSQYSVGIGL